MSIAETFPLDDPPAQIRWGLQEPPFRDHFGSVPLIEVTQGHLSARCRLLGGLDAEVHFHFRPLVAGRFVQVELYRHVKPHREPSFDDWQRRLEALLGPPQPGHPTDFPYPYAGPYSWRLGPVEVFHEWYYHAGEHERILFTCTKL